MSKGKNNNIIVFKGKTEGPKKKYFLLVSDDEVIMEAWAQDWSHLLSVENIYDEDEQPHPVSLIIDVQARKIYDIAFSDEDDNCIPFGSEKEEVLSHERRMALHKKELDDCDIEEMIEDWGLEAVEKGYAVFADRETSIHMGEYIDKIDELQTFNTSKAARKQAAKDGVKFINDMEGVEPNFYIDTPKNREHIAGVLHEYRKMSKPPITPKSEVNGFILTDDDTFQYRKALGERRYQLIEISELHGLGYYVFESLVDLSRYTEDEIEILINGYYDSYEAFIRRYKAEADDLIAECIFESEMKPGDEIFFTKDEGEAVSFIEKFMADYQV